MKNFLLRVSILCMLTLDNEIERNLTSLLSSD